MHTFGSKMCAPLQLFKLNEKELAASEMEQRENGGRESILSQKPGSQATNEKSSTQKLLNDRIQATVCSCVCVCVRVRKCLHMSSDVPVCPLYA